MNQETASAMGVVLGMIFCALVACAVSLSKIADVLERLAFEIVKHIISVRVAERDAEALKKKRAEEKQRILALIADKQDEALKVKSLEELQAMVQAL